MYPQVREPNVNQEQVKDLAARITRFESGEMEEGEVFALFQTLIDTGVINVLQGTYQRIAVDLLRAGQVFLPVQFGGEALGR
jgi:hypothetical protein